MSKNDEQFPQQKFTYVDFERRKICKYLFFLTLLDGQQFGTTSKGEGEG